jgi:NAD(P)-dependent dehydrogenase (short-subunit alcohol dehydrogenase family)
MESSASVDIDGRVALVTGAAMGIGKGIARQLGHVGAKVVIADINDEAGQAPVREFKDTGVAVRFIHTDVAEDDNVQRMIDATVDQFGAIDILVNSAGIGMNGVIPGTPPEVWTEVLHIFLRQYMFGTQIAFRAMENRGWRNCEHRIVGRRRLRTTGVAGVRGGKGRRDTVHRLHGPAQ